MPRLSVTIICCNEEDAIEECLQSISWANEIVVVDSGSRDGTVDICRRYTDRVYEIPWEGYGRQKNRALERATGDWVLSLDADERVTPELRESILSAIAGETPQAGYEVSRRNFFLGRWMRHGGWYPDRQTRLFRRDRARFSERPVHERVLVDGPVGRLDGDLLHYTYRTLPDYLARQERYAALGAEARWQEGKRAALWRIPWEGLVRFALTYLYKQGFRDGAEGLIAALLASCYVVVRQARLWEMGREAARTASPGRRPPPG